METQALIAVTTDDSAPEGGSALHELALEQLDQCVAPSGLHCVLAEFEDAAVGRCQRHVAGPPVRVMSITQLRTQVSPPSNENSCSHPADRFRLGRLLECQRGRIPVAVGPG